MACRGPQRERSAALSEAAEIRRAERAALALKVRKMRAEKLPWSVVKQRLASHSLSHLQKLAAEPVHAVDEQQEPTP